MTGPLNDLERVQLADLAATADELGLHEKADALRHALETLDAQAAVIARINDGWEYVRPLSRYRKAVGRWFRVQDGKGDWVVAGGATDIPREPMTEAEQNVVYGAVVRPETEEAE